MSAPTPVAGTCDSAFEPVREALHANFRDHDEVGAGVCVLIDGRTVLDLWGGHCDAERRRPWQRDTLVNAYSVGKGVTAMLALALVERGALDLDEPVSERWPEFAAAGKAGTTLRTLLSHRAGLPAVRRPLPEGAMLEWDTMAGALAEQTPYWTPGEQHGYHVNTYGYLVGELVCRATGSAFATALREQLTGPLQADYHIGLAASEHARCADVCGPSAHYRASSPDAFTAAFPPTGDAEHDAMIRHTYGNPPGLSGLGVVNTAGWREASIPSTNGHGTARAVAALYEAFLHREPAAGGPVGAGLRREARRIHSDGVDRVLGRPSRFGLGFQLAQPERPLGRSPHAFGHFGYGGSLGFADPDTGLAFGYVMNHPGDRWKTPRATNLVNAVYDCL
ncbi:MAG: beta-lactamase family protein [Proteobacteria bacterium]|nr:beta-lactamase family protein [Pseudomonadota bacterium]